MTGTLSRNTLLRRLLSLWVAFAFVLSTTNIALAVPVVPVGLATQAIVQPIEQPTVVPAMFNADLFPHMTIAPASHVAPVEVSGNPSLTAGGLRLDESVLPGTFTHMFMGIEIEITVSVQETPDGMEFSFVSDYPVTKVVAKGGNTGANVYEYAPAVLSDSGLHTPMNPSGKWADISHLDFYFAAPADLTVVKYHDLDGDGMQDEGEPELSGWSFKLKNASDQVVDEGVTNGSGVVVFDNVTPGVYTVTEVTADDWLVTTDPYPVTVVLGSGEDETVHIGNIHVADVEVLKFDDVDSDGVRDEGEALLDGWTIRLHDGNDVVASDTTVDGSVVFSDVLPGSYTVDEVLKDGWTNTTPLPLEIVVVGGQDATYLIGNHHEDVVRTVTKTFELTYVGAPAGMEFVAVYQLVDGPAVEVALSPAGEGVHSGSVELPAGSVIDSVTWKAVLDGATFVLGAQTGLNEVLDGDVVNEFTYSASVSGHKFGDVDEDGVWDEGEVGLAGWTIGLYRAGAQSQPNDLPLPQPGYGLVAQTVTGSGGTYSFTGLLPGTYYVAEQMQGGWFMTVGPEGTVDVSDGTALTGLDFGNAEESLPFTQFEFDKTVDREFADPGDIVTYALTYSLTADSDPWTDPIPISDDYDATYMTPIDVAGGIVANGMINWVDNVDMQPGESRTIFYTMMVAADMPVGETNLPNFALLDVQDGYPDDENVVVVVDEPVLPFTEFEFDKSANLSVAKPGDVVTYTLTYSLTDDSGAFTDPIRVVDDYDQRYMKPVDVGDGVVSEGTIVWTDNADMEPGETRTIVYTMKIDAEMPVGTTAIKNVALLDVQDGYEDEWTVKVPVEGEPFLPFTGGDVTLIAFAMLVIAATGVVLRLHGQPIES